jgi:CBS domain-containing protein
VAAYAAEVRASVARLVDAETPVDDIGRLAGSAQDALVARIIREAERNLGPPPAPYAFMVLGSQARLEATLHTDQDHALALADDAGPEAEAWAARLADEVVVGLERCGFPRCPGGIMASNPRWRVPLATWEGYFRAWMEEPDEQGLADTTIFFDFRQLGGTLDAEAALRAVVGEATEHPAFLARLAFTALRRESPLDVFGQLRGMRQGRRRVLDLKLRGIAGIVDLARVFALEAGVPETNTLVRLRLAAERGVPVAHDLAEAFEYLQQVRLRHQVRQLRAGAEPDNVVPIAELTLLERRWLRDLFRLLNIAGESVRLHLQADLRT